MATKGKKPEKAVDPIAPLVARFDKLLSPHNTTKMASVYTDECTGARYCEVHVTAKSLVDFATPDYPIDPEDQPEYRANREIVVDAPAFERMRGDALKGRTFSNIVCEFTEDFEPEKPLKIIGGQHRLKAIGESYAAGINSWHGVKVYFALTKDQRTDVQLISNTSIAISGDLLDRMQETVRGPELRDWCQSIGLLGAGLDFADKRARGGPISVQVAKTFILNYFAGTKIIDNKFDLSDTTPVLCPVGQISFEWEKLRKEKPKLFEDAGLLRAGKEFVRLHTAQRAAFASKKSKPDYPEKAMNLAIIAAWAYVAGVLHKNEQRLQRHYQLADKKGGDPLAVAALAFGKHKTDSETYRGLGYRTDAKERSRMAELFWLQAEDGMGYSKSRVELAVSKHFAKEAMLEVKRIEAKAT